MGFITIMSFWRWSYRRAVRCSLGVGLVVLVSCARSGQPSVAGGITISPGIPKPDFTLQDTHGDPFNFRARTHGKLTYLFFGYTHCPDVCPLQMANVASALHQLPPSLARNVMVVFVTTDSERDTPKELRQWLDNFDSSFVGLIGTMARVNAVQALTGFLSPAEREPGPSGTYTVGHSAVVLAFTPDDSAHFIYPLGVQQAAWTTDMRQLAGAGPPPDTH